MRKRMHPWNRKRGLLFVAHPSASSRRNAGERRGKCPDWGKSSVHAYGPVLRMCRSLRSVLQEGIEYMSFSGRFFANHDTSIEQRT